MFMMFTELLAIFILIFLFEGEPDNWDKIGYIIDHQYDCYTDTECMQKYGGDGYE